MNIFSTIRTTREEDTLSLLYKRWSNLDTDEQLSLTNDYLQKTRTKLGRSRNEVYAKLFRMSLVLGFIMVLTEHVDTDEFWGMVITLIAFASVLNILILFLVIRGMSRSIGWASETIQHRVAIRESS